MTKSAYAKELGRTCLAREDFKMKTECGNMQKMSKISAEDWGLITEGVCEVRQQ